jgi:predicted hotdog family 3-hydroxylacyl-ACP dehydratase
VTIREDSPLVEGRQVRAVAAIEYMAQAVGVCTALRALAEGAPLRAGYLVSARNVDLETGCFRVGDELLVEATADHDSEELGTFLCSVRRGARVMARAALSVYRTDDTRRCGPP